MKRTTVSERALILAPRGRDAAIATAMLADAGLAAATCPSLVPLIGELDRGAALLVVTEEAIATADLQPLSVWLADQEEWSDLPVVLLTNRGGGLERNPAAARYLDVLGNVTFLERPFHPTTLVSLVRAALRARRRQYEARARLLALRESEERYRTLFDTMDEGFCVVAFVDGPQGPLGDYVHVQANPAYERHAGIADVVGKRVREIVGDEADGWVDLFGSVLRTGESLRFERELIATNRYLEVAAFRIEPAERGEIAIIFQDVTARKRAEIALIELNETLEGRVEEAVAERERATAQLHEAQKLETLGQLTGGVAHDINNLLTPITGALDLIARRYAGTDARAARLLDGALQSAERARVLVSRLLGFARRQALETRPVDLADLIEGMRDLMASSAGGGIELIVVAEDALPSASADPNQLELALLNLCVNARDAMDGGGTITIRAERAGTLRSALPSSLPLGDYVRLSVADTGTGMDEATLARAIEPFYSTKGIGKGTGLGLSMVHGLAAQLGGAFVLTSAVGEGTRADLYLPVADRAAERAAEPRDAPVGCSRALHVLLVDDEDLVRAGTAEMLRDMGHTVGEAASGADAIALVKEGLKPDLIVTDYMMPRMDGAELAGHLRRIDPQLPVLVITGYAGGVAEIGLPQLAKPFRQSDLAAAIEQVVAAGDTSVHLPARHG